MGLARGGPKQLGLHGLAHYAARALAAQPSAHGNEPGTAVGTLPRDESAQTTPPIPANRVVLLTGAPRAFRLFVPGRVGGCMPVSIHVAKSIDRMGTSFTISILTCPAPSFSVEILSMGKL